MSSDTQNAGVVSWAGPVEQAVQNLREATDLLEAKKLEGGIEKLREAKDHIDAAIAFINSA